MPIYEYECQSHGAFEALRPMAESHLAQPCPECGKAAGRVVLSAAAFSALSSTVRKAHSINETARHEPKSSKQMHGSGCSCCSGGQRASSKTLQGRNGERSFPKSRPWMISH